MENRLEEIRKARGIKQEDLALELGVSRQTISSLEKGRYNPSILPAFKIARRFGLQIEDVFIYQVLVSDMGNYIWYQHFYSKSRFYRLTI